MIRNPLIATRLFNTPLMVHPAKLDAIIAGLSERLGIGHYDAPAPSAFTTQKGQPAESGLYRIVGGIAVFNIFGVLAHRGGFQADSSYILGYQTIARQFDAAMQDAEVKGVLLNLDSPGGEVAGAFDLAQQIADYRGKKPVRAAISDLAASAAYLIASATDEIAIAQNGYAGSIGVVMRHVDLSQALSKEGIRVTHIFAGERKIDGNPYEPLPEAVRGQFQAEVDGIYEAFVTAVAANRRLEPEAVRATQAAVFRGAAAQEMRLADRIATPDQVIAQMQENKPRASARPIPRGKSMSTQSDADATFTQAELVSAKAQSHEEGRKAGVQAEAERIFGILNHAEAEGRGAQAIALAEAGLTVEQAAKVLAATPITTLEATAANPFVAHMQALGNPAVGPDNPAPPNDREAAQAVWGRAFGRA